MLTIQEQIDIITSRINAYKLTLSHFDDIMNDKINLDLLENMTKETIPQASQDIKTSIDLLNTQIALLTATN